MRRLADFQPGQLLVQIIDLNSGDASGSGDDLGIVLMGDDFVADLHVNVGDHVVAVFHAAIFDGDERSLLLAQVLHRLLDVLFGDVDLRAS